MKNNAQREHNAQSMMAIFIPKHLYHELVFGQPFDFKTFRLTTPEKWADFRQNILYPGNVLTWWAYHKQMAKIRQDLDKEAIRKERGRIFEAMVFDPQYAFPSPSHYLECWLELTLHLLSKYHYHRDEDHSEKLPFQLTQHLAWIFGEHLPHGREMYPHFRLVGPVGTMNCAPVLLLGNACQMDYYHWHSCTLVRGIDDETDVPITAVLEADDPWALISD